MSSGSRNYDEKRDFMRMTVDCRVDFKDTNGRDHQGRAINLSGGGLLFITDAPLTLGAELQLSVKPDAPVIQPLDVVGKVVRVDRVDGKFEVGVNITRRV